MISWAQLTTPPTIDAIFARLITFAKALKLPTFSWGPKNFLRAALGLFAQVLGDQFGTVIADIAKGGFRTTAPGDWLTLIASEFYGIDREPAVFTDGTVTLTNVSTTPQTIAIGDLAFETIGGQIFTNITGGSLAGPGSLPLSWRAEHAGSAYNVGGESVVLLSTPLPGVSISALAGESWITTLGVDEESDADLSTRCGERWDTLGPTPGTTAYAFNAILAGVAVASGQVTRTRVYEATPIPSYVTMYLAGPTGPVSTTVANAVRQWFEDNAKRPQCVGLLIYPANSRVVSLTGTVTVKAAQLAAAQAAISAGLVALEKGTDFGGLVDVNELIALVRTAPGCTRLVLTTPAADVALAPSEVVSFVDALTYVAT